MKEFVYYNCLFDLYSELLTEKEQETFKDYYQEDLSLAEIAEENNISRTAVQKTIKSVLEKLNYYEDKLNIFHKNEKLRKILEINNVDEIKNVIEEILGE